MALGIGKKEVAYASLDMDSPQPPAAMRRSASGSGSLSNLQLDSPSSSATTVVSEDSSGYFVNGADARRSTVGIPESRAFSHTVAYDMIAALERPVRQLAFEVKGALLATG